jgi:hypothetical protein
MPRYEVKFEIEKKNELTEAEIAGLSHSVVSAMRRDAEEKVLDRRVYVRRVYEPHEEREIVKRHAAGNSAAGRSWDCSCHLCEEYRRLGFTVNAK